MVKVVRAGCTEAVQKQPMYVIVRKISRLGSGANLEFPRQACTLVYLFVLRSWQVEDCALAEVRVVRDTIIIYLLVTRMYL